jgi:hypothetical protein
VENFCTLAQEGYYNGIIFHRIIKKFVCPFRLYYLLRAKADFILSSVDAANG